MYNLIKHITEDDGEKGPRLALDFADEIVAATCIAHGGEVRHGPTLEALEGIREGRS
jgi:NAD(P) transhydrogenase subunit alpha